VAPRDRKRLPKLHQRRDLCAGLELCYALYELGYRRGEQIFNQPPRKGPQQPPPGAKPFHVDLSFVDPTDILLQFTRPPYSDLRSGPKRKITPSHTDLEQRLFKVWELNFLPISARNHVQVHQNLHPRFEPGFEYCREMSFKQKVWGAPYNEVNAQEGDGWRKYRGKRKTVVFLLRVEQAWAGGPGYVCAFGMDGCTTLVWAYRLSRDYRHLLEQPRFVMAELELGRMPVHPTDLRWCMDWKITPILVHDVPEELVA
jgi:hypothetical protein